MGWGHPLGFRCALQSVSREAARPLPTVQMRTWLREVGCAAQGHTARSWWAQPRHCTAQRQGSVFGRTGAAQPALAPALFGHSLVAQWQSCLSRTGVACSCAKDETEVDHPKEVGFRKGQFQGTRFLVFAVNGSKNNPATWPKPSPRADC